MDKGKSAMPLLAIVAIVAVVAVVVLVLNVGVSSTGEAFSFRTCKSELTSCQQNLAACQGPEQCEELIRALTPIYTAELMWSGKTYSFEVELGALPKIRFTSWISGQQFERALYAQSDGTHKATHKESGYTYSIITDVKQMRLSIETAPRESISRPLSMKYKALVIWAGNTHPFTVDIESLKLTFVSPCSGETLERPLMLGEDGRYTAQWSEKGATSTIIIDVGNLKATVPVCCTK